MKTYTPKQGEIQQEWYIVDATDQILGRLAVDIARVLRGKHKPNFTPNLDVGDYVIVINAEKIKTTGNKLKEKMYYRHSGYPGGLRSMSLEEMLKKHPERVIEEAVRGMIPHNSLGAQQLAKLKVYAGPAHPHQAQQPRPFSEAGAFMAQPAGAPIEG